MAEVNWAALAAEAGDVKPVPAGNYEVIIEKAELKTSSNTGREYWAVTLVITSGPHARRRLFNNFVLSTDNPNALRAFFINMQNLGIDQAQIMALGSDTSALTPLLPGRRALVTTSLREYAGSMRENVDRVAKHPAGPIGDLGSINQLA